MTTPKIDVIKSNMTVLYTDNFTILYSYNTPVACYEYETRKYYCTNQFHSMTTSKHINQWLGTNQAEQKDQNWFTNLS